MRSSYFCYSIGLMVACYLRLVVATHAELVTVDYEAEAATVVGTPFGLTVPRLTPFTGSFTYDTSTVDIDSRTDYGEFPHIVSEPYFDANFATHRITGSGFPVYEVGFGTTFRLSDGPVRTGISTGVMSLNDVLQPEMEMWISIVGSQGSILDDNVLPAPFPTSYTFGFLGTPHTFFIRDTLGSVLLQITQATMRGGCDFVGATGCDIDDMDALYEGEGTAPTPVTNDLIGQWLIDASSVSNPLKTNSWDTYVYGDLDLDGDVDSADLGNLLNHYLATGDVGWGQGNLNTANVVDSADLGLLLNRFGYQSSPTLVVPEPSTSLGGILGMLGFLLAVHNAIRS